MPQPVNMVAPDGSPVNTDPENVETLVSQGYTLAPATQQAMVPPAEQAAAGLGDLAPAPGPGEGLGDVVNLFAPDGSPVNADAQHVETLLSQGYTIATPEAMAQTREAEEYGGFTQGAKAFGEGALQGATIGTYGLAASALDEDYDRARRLREEYHPIAETAGEVTGAVLPAVFSGGSSTLGTAARFTPAALEASLGAKMASALGGKAAQWVGGRAAATAGRAVATGLESAADTALRQVLDDAANGDVDVTAERTADALWNGLATGSALDLGLAGVGAAARGAGRVAKAGAEKARGALKGVLPESLADAAGEAAWRAAVGRTDIRSQRLASRIGGGAEIGKTLLDRGVVKRGQTVEQIAELLPAEREKAGQELRKVLDEVAGDTTSRSAVMERIEREVLQPLDQAGSQDIAQAVRTKLDASGIAGAFDPAAAGDAITLGELHKIRRTLDTRPDLKWGSAGPQAPDITTEAMRDIRRTVEDVFEEASDEAASARGVKDYAQRLRQAKREYSHLALASDVAEQGAFSRTSNNRLGLNDVLAGVGGAAALGPVGAAAALGSRFARARFESTTASLLHDLGKRGRKAGKEAVDAAEALSGVSTGGFRVADDAADKVAAMNAAEVKRSAAEGTGRGRYTLVDVPIDQIVPQEVWSESKITPIRKALKDGKPLPPVRLAMDDAGQISIEDGIHRINAVREAGGTHVPAIVEEFIPAGGIEPPALAFAPPPMSPARTEAASARLLYGLAKRGDNVPLTALGRLTQGAADTQKALTRSADDAVRSALDPERRAVARQAITVASAGQVQRAIERASALQDPNSRESQALERTMADLSKDDPALAQALRASVQQRSDFIAGKLPPSTDPADPLGRAAGRADAFTQRKTGKYVRAAMDPQAALARLSAGVGTPEDAETLQALQPRLYQQYVEQAMARFKDAKKPPTFRARQRMGRMLRQPMDRASRPESVAFFQTLKAPPQIQPSDNPNLAPVSPPPPKRSDVDRRDNVYASRTDQIMERS